MRDDIVIVHIGNQRLLVHDVTITANWNRANHDAAIAFVRLPQEIVMSGPMWISPLFGWLVRRHLLQVLALPAPRG